MRFVHSSQIPQGQRTSPEDSTTKNNAPNHAKLHLTPGWSLHRPFLVSLGSESEPEMGASEWPGQLVCFALQKGSWENAFLAFSACIMGGRLHCGAPEGRVPGQERVLMLGSQRITKVYYKYSLQGGSLLLIPVLPLLLGKETLCFLGEPPSPTLRLSGSVISVCPSPFQFLQPRISC